MSPTPEENFRRFALAGDLAALGRVFDTLAVELHAVARRLAPASPTESAEDLVQATFLTAIEKAGDYDGRRPLAAWLVGILALHAKNARRKVSRRGQMASLDAERDSHVGPPEPRSKAPDPAEATVAADWIATVRAAVASAPHTYRPVLQAVLFDGATPAEAALALDLNPGTVRQRLHRGLAKLRETLVGSPARSIAGLAASLAFARRSAAMRETVLAAAAPGGGPGGTLAASSIGTTGGGLASGGLPAGLALTALAALAIWSVAHDVGPLDERREGLALLTVDGDRTALALAAGEAPVPPRPDGLAVRTSVPEPGPRPARPPMRKVEGRVFATNATAGLAGVEVILHGEDGPEVLTRSDADGSFEFSMPRADLPADGGLAKLDFELRAEGFQRWRMPKDPSRVDAMLRSASMSASPRAISLLVHLHPAHHVRGQVVDAQGLGTPADLYLLDAHGQLAGEDPIGSTDARGHFDLRPVGGYFYGDPRPLPLLALAAEGTGFLLAGQGLPRDLAPGEPPPVLDDLVIVLASLSLEARVVDADGRPLPGVLVEAKAYDHTWNTGTPRTPALGRRLWREQVPPALGARFRSTSDHDGRVRFEHLPRVDSPYVGRVNDEPMTRWTLHAEESGYLPVTDHDSLVLPLGLPFGGEPTELVLRRRDPLTVRGRVLGPDGLPRDCAQLCALELDAGFLSDEAGRWSFELPDRSDLPARIQAVVPGFATRTWSLTEELVADAVELTHDFHMLAPVGLSLRCVDPAGVPLDGVPVHVTGTDPDSGEPWDLGWTTTQLGGWARYDEAPAGTWTVRLGDGHLASDLAIEPVEEQLVVGAAPVERVYTVVPR